jgi:hypothetical protein
MKKILVILVIGLAGCKNEPEKTNKIDEIGVGIKQLGRQRDSFYYLYRAYKDFFERCGCHYEAEESINKFISDELNKNQ